ncbi:hypothetical protein Tco_1290301 [Tanacetum coccineum]
MTGTATIWGNWGMKHITDAYEAEVIPFVKSLRESFKLFKMELYKEENDASSELLSMFIDKCDKCKSLKTELLNLQETNKSFHKLSKCFSIIEEYCITLEHSLQHNNEQMVCNESWKKHDASLITDINNKSFEGNDLKTQLQEKSIVVNELKQLLAKLKG